MKGFTVSLIVGFLFLLTACSQTKVVKNESLKKPNIIYILADDLGYGDLSCYAQVKFSTPNLDRLAQQGMKFTQHYSGSAVCAPSRSTLMTGQHTGHTPIRGNKESETSDEGQVPLPANAVTLAEFLKTAGYTTGMFGKWGLGFNEGDPNAQGFDEFYGYNCQRLAHRYYPPYLNHNQKRDSLKGNDWTHKVTYAPDEIQAKTLQFIEANKDEPFFAYVPFVLPHGELISPNDSLFNKFKGKFEEVPLKATDSYTSDYGPNIDPKEYCPQEMPYAAFASMVSRLDVYVGQIMKKVEALGIADNTIIMFASDNGPHTEGGANPTYFNSGGGLRGVKRDLYEGGIRTPFIVSWPSKLKAGTVSNHVSAFWDVLPTVAEVLGKEAPKNSDGISFLPNLVKNGVQKNHEYLYWELNVVGGRKAVRKDNWKGVYYNVTNDKKRIFELFDLSKDVAEKNNVAEQHPEIVTELKGLIDKAHTTSTLFPFE